MVHQSWILSHWQVTVYTFITIIFICCADLYPSKFLEQWKSITSSRFVLNMVKGHHLKFRCHLPLFHNFKWFHIKAAPVHHPITHEEVEELLTKDATEPLTGGAGVY